MEKREQVKQTPAGGAAWREVIRDRWRKYMEIYLPPAARERLDSGGRKSILRILRGIGMGLYAFLLSCAPFPFGPSPLGQAVLCATSESVPYVYVGILLSLLRQAGDGMTGLLEASALLICRMGIGFFLSASSGEGKLRLFREGLLFRLGAGAAVSFLFGLLRVVQSGFLYYDIFGALTMVFGVPLAAWLFHSARHTANAESSLREAGINACLAAGIYALRAFEVGAVSFAVPASFLVTLYIAQNGGMLRGCFTGLVCGLASAPEMGAVMALAGICAGLFRNTSRSASVTAAAVITVIGGAYARGWQALRVLIPETVIPTMIFLPLMQFGLLPRSRLFGGTDARVQGREAQLTTRRAQRTTGQLRALSGALESLSDVFFNLSDKLRRPGIYGVRRRCYAEFEDHCNGCPLRSKCHDAPDSRVPDAVEDIARVLQKQEKLTADDLPDWMRSGCPRAMVILASLNLGIADLREDLRVRDKTGIVAMDYESLSHLVEDAADEDPDLTYDAACSEKVLHAAEYLDLGIDSAAVYGKRRKTLICGGVDLGAFRMGADALRDSMNRLCETNFDVPSFQMENADGRGPSYVTMTMQSARRFSVESACAGRATPEETVNGDNLITFENEDDYFYTLLSDGMGTGREAALTSRICGVFMEKMLRATTRKDIVLQMLNGVIRTKGMECFATVDLLEVDLITGAASFIKGGAAPSYVLRDGSLFKIASNTMPIGITKEMNAEEVRFTLEEGDVVVMASDGIAQSFEDGIWLVDLLSDGVDSDLHATAEKIMEAARRHRPDADDMSVGLIRMHAA